MTYVEITDDTFIAGEPALTGEKFEVDEATAKQLVRCERAKRCGAPAEAVEAAKPKAKKV